MIRLNDSSSWTRGWLLSVTVFSLVVAGCGDDEKPTKTTPKTAPKTAPVAAPAATEVETSTPTEALVEAEPEYVYTPIGKRDPFRTPFVEVVAVAGGDDPDRRTLTELQKWGVEQLKLQATITGTSAPFAMVVDPKGKGHVLRRGTLVGKNWGKVTAIKANCIVITEQLRDATGAVSAHPLTRCLPLTEREKQMAGQIN